MIYYLYAYGMINLMKLYGWAFSKKYIYKYQHNEIICLLKIGDSWHRIYGNIF